MAIDAAQLLARVGADTSDAERTMRDFSGDLSRMGNEFGAALLKNDLVKMATRAMLDLGQTALDSYASNERLGQSFETLIAKELRHADASLSMNEALAQAGPLAQDLLKWNQQLAIDSPFNEQGVALAFRTAEAYGFVSETADQTDVDAKRLTQTLIDFAAGSGQTEETMNRVALALGQIQAKGKLAGQEVLQLVNAGISVDQILADAFGKSTSEIVALRESGMIPADQAIQAIVESLETDFGGAAKRQASSVSGLISSLEDLYAIGSRDILGPAFQSAQPYVAKLVEDLQSPEAKQNMQELGSAIGTLVGEGIPKLIDLGGQVVTIIESIGEAGEPVWTFLGENATPIVIGLGTAYTVSLIPGLFASVGAFAASATAASAILGPLGLVALAIGGVAAAWEDYQNKISSETENYLNSEEYWNGATHALDDYAKASPSVQSATKEQAEALRQLREEQIAAGEAYADHTAQYREFGVAMQAFGINEESLAAEQQAMTDRAQRIKNLAGELDRATTAATANATAETQRGAATGEATLQLQMSTEQLQQYQDKLSAAGEKGEEAFERLRDAQTDYQEQTAERQAAHAERVTQLTADAARKQADDERQFQEQRADSAQQYQEQIVDLQQRSQEQAATAQEQYQEQAEQAAETHQAKLLDLQAKAADLAADYQRREADDLAEHWDRVADIQQRGNDDTAERDRQYQENREQAASSGADRIAAIEDQLADTQARYAEQAADRAQQYADRVRDLNQRATDREYEQKQDFQDKQADKADDHNRRLADLQADYAAATTDKDRARIQAQIDAENEKYTIQLARDQRDYDRRRQREQEQLAQDLARAERERQQADAEAAEKAQRDQDKYVRELAAQEAANAAKQQQLTDAYERERTEQQQAISQKLAAEDASYAKERAQRAQDFQERQADLTAQLAAEQSTYTRERAQADQHYQATQAKRQQDTAKDLADLQTKHEREEASRQAHYERESQARADELARRLADEDASFAQQQAKAAAQWAEQEADLKEALGKQLAAYTDIQEKMTLVSAAEADKRRAQIAAQFGYNPDATQTQFARDLAGVGLGPNVGGVAVAGAAAGLGASNMINATIIIQGITDPQAVALAVREQLLLLQQQNGTIGFGIGGGGGGSW